DAQPGDLIEIYREFYQHWALYLGDGYVIHVAPLDNELPSSLRNMAFVLARKGKVKKELLKEVVGNDKWRVNNKYDCSYTPYSVEEIIQRAKERIDSELSYGALTNNCEHFVTMLRYGKRRSDQVS
ncbi:HRSL1 enzyme, partial [Sterrhoptilus dennistouni]|nr:HRSL1 enzyme [Sterrhoptilus dennistouni]